MYSKELTIDDLDDIKSCIYHHNTIYGVPIDHESLLLKIQNIFTYGKVYGCYDNDECIGIGTQYFWKAMPVWIFSNVYVKNSAATLRLTDYHIEVVSMLMYEAIKYAETKECFEFYYVLRDRLNTSRKKNDRKVFQTVNPAILERYEFENMHFLSTIEDIKWDYIRSIIGQTGVTAIQNKKLLVVRRGRLSRAARETS